MRTLAYLLSIGGTFAGNATTNDTASVTAFTIAVACLAAGAAPAGALARAVTPLVSLSVWREKK